MHVPPRYPDAVLDLATTGAHALAVMAATDRALSRAGVPRAEIDKFYREAMRGDYDHLLRTMMAWVSVDDTRDD